jgi:glycogen(starch) synthase
MRRETLDGLQADPDRIVVVPNGVDVAAWATTAEQRAAARASAGVPAGSRVVVLVGRLEYEKGGQDAIDALALLPPDVHLVLVGIGGRHDALAAQAAAAGLADRVHLVGRLRDATVAGLLGAADLALVPSRYEPFGLVALEAMAAGTPVVVARTGGLGDLVRPGETGLVVPPASPPALAEAVTRVLADPEGSRAMAQRAQIDAAERFGWDAVAARTLAAYSSVLAVR